MKTYTCEHCGKTFPANRSLHHHRRDAHTATKTPQPIRERTFADLAMDAQLDAAMGTYNADQEWLS